MFRTKVVEKIKRNILSSVFFFFFENRAVFETMWKKYGKARQDTGGNIARRMRIACWITKVTNTHSEYVIFIAFPLQQWLHERASMLRYTYFACLVHGFHYPLQAYLFFTSFKFFTDCSGLYDVV